MRRDHLRAQRFAALLALGTRLRDAHETEEPCQIAPEEMATLADAIDDCLAVRAQLNALLEAEPRAARPQPVVKSSAWKRALDRSSAA